MEMIRSTLAAIVLASLVAAPAYSFAKATAAHVQIAQTEKVNINTATLADFSHVKGLGKKHAEAIIAYRKEHGYFKTVAELSSVKGMGQKLLAKMESRLTVA